MRKRYIIGIIVAGLIAVGCGSSPDTGTETGTEAAAGSSDSNSSAKAAPAYSIMGKGARKFDSGIVVAVSKPRKITPGDWTIGHKKGNTAIDFTVTVTNNDNEPYDVTWLTVTVDMGKDGIQAEQIFGDGYSSAEGQIQVGKKKTMKVAFSAPTKDTSEINVVVEPGLSDGITAMFQGKL
jgi:hypothetical protein